MTLYTISSQPLASGSFASQCNAADAFNAVSRLHRSAHNGNLRPVVEHSRRLCILIVDDRPSNLVALRAVLDPLGHEILQANSGREALQALLRQTVDLLLLDVNMPDMSGFATARLVRQRTPAAMMPILFVSAREPSAADLAEGYSLGAVDYVTKPVIPEVLRAKVTALLDVQRRAIDLESTVQARSAELADLTDRADQLRASIGELEAFSYSVSHDLRAPLRAIHGFAEALQTDFGASMPDEAQGYVKRIVRAAAHLDRMIMDVLAYSRMDVAPARVQALDPERLIRSAIEHDPMLQPAQAEICVEAPLPEVMGDEASLQQCVANLLGNAVKFVAPGVKPRVRISARRVGAHVRLWIEDNGIGIPRDQHAKIFEAFARLHSGYTGTGFGLSIVRKAVQRMGGKVGVESDSGQGSRFWIELPAP